jgi:hypothetical protein
MTDVERVRWQRYARDLADRMGLKDWTIEFPGERWHANDNGGSASATLAYGRRLIRIHLPDRFHCDSLEEQRDSIVHELVHCHFAMMDGMVEDWLDGEKYKAYRRAWEYGIDAMAAALAPHLPLPPGGED